MFDNMNNTIKVIIGAGLAYAAFKFFRKGKTAKTLNIKIRSLKLRPFSKAAIVLEVINPTNETLNLNSIVADVLINDFAISTINYQQPTKIPANGSRNFELRIKINPLEGAAFIANLLASKTLGVVTVKGTVSGEGITAPILLTQNLSL